MRYALLFTALILGCAKPPCAPPTDLAKLEAVCIARVKLECAQGDRLCPAYVYCKEKIEAWRTCR